MCGVPVPLCVISSGQNLATCRFHLLTFLYGENVTYEILKCLISLKSDISIQKVYTVYIIRFILIIHTRGSLDFNQAPYYLLRECSL